MVTEENVMRVFEYHTPTAEQVERMQSIRVSASALALVILWNTPKSADQQAALRKVREAVMTANAAVVLGEI